MAVGLLDRYIWRHLSGLFVFGVAIFTTFLMVNHLFFLARLVFDEGATFLVALKMLVYRLPYFLAFSFPMAMLLASLMAVSRLSDGQEITAMRTAGISLSRIASSVVLAGVLVSVGTLVWNESVVPPAEDRYEVSFAQVVKRPRQIAERVLFRETQGSIESVYFVRRFHSDQDLMEGVVVDQFEQGKLRRVIDAANARYLGNQWEFLDGTLYVFTEGTTVATRFERLDFALRRTPDEIAGPQKPVSDMSIHELRAYIAVLRRGGEDVTRYVVEMQSKVSVPMSALLFALLAVPLGLRPHRSGPSIGLGLTILVLVGYYILTSITLTLGEGGRLHPVAAAWLPNVILAGAAVLLLRRVDR